MPIDAARMPTSGAFNPLASSTYHRLAEHYTDKLALNWRRRARLLASTTSDFADLLDWDGRIEAGLDALRHLGAAAQQHLMQLLHAPIHPGEAFVALAHGLSVQNAELVQSTCAIVRSLPGQGGLADALVAALEWAPVSPLWRQTLDTLPLLLRLRVLATRQNDAPHLLATAFEALRATQPEADVLAAALRCLQYRGDARAAEDGRHFLDVGDARLRLVAADALLTLCDPQHAGRTIEVLQALVRDEPAQREAAACCLALHAPAQCLPLLAELQRRAGEDTAPALHLYLQALGWAGQIDAVPVLIDHLDDPAHARISAASLMLLTGSDPVRDGWQGPALVVPQPPAEDATNAAIPPSDPDAGLIWPSKTGFAAHWGGLRKQFGGAPTWFAGRPATVDSLQAVLHQGRLAWRPLAAARLQRLTASPLFPTHLPAPAQATLFPTR